MKRLNSLTLALVFITCAHAQEQAAMLQPELISDNGVFGFTLSPDGRHGLWVKSNGKRDTLYIVESNRSDRGWTQPQVASFSTGDGKWKDIDPIFSPDGNMILFQSTRPVPGKPQRTGFDIWAVKRTPNGWSEAFHLGNDINGEDSESYASITANQHIYFMKSAEGQPANSDIFVSRWNGHSWQKPENLGMPVNTISNRESNPFISEEEDFLIYFSTDSSGFGEVDLYISFRENDKWTKPKNLGPAINTRQAEFCPFYHKKEKRLYFSRQERLKDRMNENIYSINFDPDSYRQ